MLHLHFSNHLEVLVRRLLANLDASPAGVFEAEQVIVPSAAVRRWLTLALARERGVCANVEFGFLARWLWRQIARCVPGVARESPFAAPLLGWRAYAALEDPAFVAAHPRLAAYLDAADDVMRYELAMRVGELFEQYVTYRPDWLQAWTGQRSSGLPGADATLRADEAWQAALWRRVTSGLGVSAVHPGEAFLQALEDDAAAAALPGSAHLVALPAMPPLYLPWLARLGRRMDLHLYVLNPCREYWFDVVDRRRLAHLRARCADAAHDEGNRLLAAWGKQAQSHIDLLVDACGEDAVDDAAFERADDATLLGRLQNAILDLHELAPGSVRPAAADRSLEVHVCHGLMREVEVLHDHLLGLFARDDGLQPSDVLVVTPDIDAAAPIVEAVFGTAPPERRIPYAITGRARSTVNLPARALLSLLALASSRLPATAVFGVLEQDVVARRFGLDADALQQVHDWMRASGFRWGLDAPHRARCGVPGTARHTLSESLDRLFLGYALPAHAAAPFGGLLPAGDAEGSEAVALGAYAEFAHALAQWRERLAVPHTPQGWSAVLLDGLATFVEAGADELDDLRELQADVQDLADTLRRGGIERPVPLPVLRAALARWLDDPARGGVPTGGVTFASMGSLRSLPYAVVCMVGLNDGSFPTASRPPEFDLLALQPRRGDRQRRHDERNLFLDLLLSARRSVYLSYAGRSIRDNAPQPPSVLVAELLDVLVPAIADDPASAASLARARARLVVEHPLQAFSLAAFSAEVDERLRSHDRETWQALCRGLEAAGNAPPSRPAGPAGPAADADADADADAGAGAGAGAGVGVGVGVGAGVGAGAGASADESGAANGGDAPADLDDDEAVDDPMRPFFSGPLPTPGPEWRDVSLEQLVDFFRNPCRYLLRQRLGVELQHADEELQDEEPFLPDFRGRSDLALRLLPPLLQGAPEQDVLALARAGAELPAGPIGRLALERELQRLQAFARRVRDATRDPCLPPLQAVARVDLNGEAWSVQAAFSDLRAGGLVRWRYGELRAADLVAAWLHHLLLCAAAPAGAAACTDWHLVDRRLRLRAPEDAGALLRELVAVYRRGLCAPVHFFPKAAWTYVNEGRNMRRAREAWLPTTQRPWSEGADAAYRLALRGCGDPLDADFAALAQAVFEPAMRHLDDETAMPQADHEVATP